MAIHEMYPYICVRNADKAIDFYVRNGFTVVSKDEKERLLRKYWSIPDRQIETSVVLADRRWVARRGGDL